MMLDRLRLLARHLFGRRVIVLGDVILDEYVYGSVERISREAPVPVLEFRERRFVPGGAANPASNIVTLGSHAQQIGIVGMDASAEQLRRTLAERKIDTGGLVACPDRPTTLKTRILAQMGLRFPHQIARVDTLSKTAIDDDVQEQIATLLAEQLPHADALLLSDYHGGLLVPKLVSLVRELGHHARVLMTVDAQGQLEKYAGFNLVKCNTEDASAYLRRDLVTDHDFEEAARNLRQQLELEALVITRGAAGATLALADGGVEHCPAPRVVDVYDTVGAGDTSIAVLTLARLAGADYRDALTLANYASGIVVRHVGNYTPTITELQDALSESEIDE